MKQRAEASAPEETDEKPESTFVGKPSIEDLRSKIVVAAEAPTTGPKIPVKKAPAGNYKILHGKFRAGYVDGEAIEANVGSIVQLDEDEATRMLADKAAEPYRATG